jgi:two-component system OmpR family sensor kinase
LFHSLRFRIPALFLAGIVIASVISTITAYQLFEDYVQDRFVAELRREAAGLTDLYATQVVQANDEDRAPPYAQAPRLEKATGDRLFYCGIDPFATQAGFGPRTLKPCPVEGNQPTTFEFTPPGARRVYLAAAQPLRPEGRGPAFGVLIVAKPKAELSDRLNTLLERLALALLGGVLIAGALAWYLSRRLTRPILALSRAADEVAEGRYDVEIPTTETGEIGHMADRFGQMARRLREATELERNFLMRVSHELRTPLTAIRGHVGALREGLADDPESREASLDVIAAEAGRLERLVGDVLDLAKLDARRFTVREEEVDMGRVLERAYSAFGEEARRRRIDYRQHANGGAVILTDGDRVLQIISNLLSNAFRWTPDGGSIEVALAGDDGSVAVSVADSGPGIATDERERIFRPFWSRDGRGTGLGLPIARELALLLGGRIELDSQPGQGSCFRLVLPRGSLSAPQGAHEGAGASLPAG